MGCNSPLSKGLRIRDSHKAHPLAWYKTYQRMAFPMMQPVAAAAVLSKYVPILFDFNIFVRCCNTPVKFKFSSLQGPYNVVNSLV